MNTGYEQCSGKNTRIYRVRELRLFDNEEERLDGPVISLLRSMPGVERADFLDQHSVLLTISVRAKWSTVERQISSLIGATEIEQSADGRLEYETELISMGASAAVARIVTDAMLEEATVEAFRQGLETWTPEELQEIYENY